MESLAIPALTQSSSKLLQVSINSSRRETYCNRYASTSICSSIYNRQPTEIRGVAFRQKGLLLRKHMVVEAVIGKKTKRESVVPDPDYRIPVKHLVFLSSFWALKMHIGLAGALIYKDNLLLAAPIGLLGLLLFFQTTRVRFVFDDEALEVRVGDELNESGENVFVGGKSRWKYSTFVNWELWWPKFPILVYFKETQTKPEGQVHFFPVIFRPVVMEGVREMQASMAMVGGYLPKASSPLN